MKRNVFLLALQFFLFVSWISPENPPAREAYEKGEYFHAMLLWEKQALNGNAIAQYNLATLHYKGLGTPKDPFEAFKWYRVSALTGNNIAMFRIGMMYLKGDGIEKNCESAFKWIKKSNENSYQEATFQLGKMYYHAKCAKRDYVKALEAFEQYYDIISKKNISNTEIINLEKYDVKKRMLETRNYIKDIFYQLGYLHFMGDGFIQNTKKALEYWEKAAEEGHKQALFSLGLAYHNGVTGKANIRLAYEYYYHSALEGEIEAIKLLREKTLEGVAFAQYRLALVYKRSIKNEKLQKILSSPEGSVEKFEDFFEEKELSNSEKFLFLLRFAAARDCTEAQHEIGKAYELGLGTPINYFMAFQWYQMAANQRMAESQYALGLMYEEGKGFDKDIFMSYVWMQISAKEGYKKAEEKLFFLEKKMTKEEALSAKNIAKFWKPHHGFERKAVPFKRIEKLEPSLP